MTLEDAMAEITECIANGVAIDKIPVQRVIHSLTYYMQKCDRLNNIIEDNNIQIHEYKKQIMYLQIKPSNTRKELEER